jgi:hypothetical protein
MTILKLADKLLNLFGKNQAKLDVSGSLRATGLSGTGMGLARVDATGMFSRFAGTNIGDVLVWDGSSWVLARPRTMARR